MATRRRALLVATDTYRHQYRRLHSPSTDVELIKNTLRLPHVDFEIEEPVMNAGREAALDAIYYFFKDSWREDHLLLYLTGHAVIERGVYYYLLPESTPDALLIKALPGNFLKDAMRIGRATSRTIIVDTCHGGHLGGKGADAAEEIDVRKLLGEGSSFLCAARGGELAYERPDPTVRVLTESTRYYSLFTSAFCLALRLGRNSSGGVLRPNGLGDYAQRLIRAYKKHSDDEDVREPYIDERDKLYGGAVLAQSVGAAAQDPLPPSPELETYFDRLRISDPDWEFPLPLDDHTGLDLDVATDIEKMIDVVAPMENVVGPKENVATPKEDLGSEFPPLSPAKRSPVLRNSDRERHFPTLAIGAGSQRPRSDGWIEIFISDFLENLRLSGLSPAEARQKLEEVIRDGAVEVRQAHLIFRQF